MQDIFSSPLDCCRRDEIYKDLTEQFSCLSICTLARSVCRRTIPYLKVGQGILPVVYVGGHHGTEWITGGVLMCFLRELCTGGRVFGTDIEKLLHRFSFFVIPVLNTDGTELQIHGADKQYILYDRQLRMNGGSDDFSHWQANARGVDLNHNYQVGFSEYKEIEKREGILGGAPTRFSGLYPESEPETAGLCTLIRLLHPVLIITLHTQGEEIFYGADCATDRMKDIAYNLCKTTGYRLSEAKGASAYGGLTDWAVRCGIPSYTLECGKGENPLPLKDGGDIYDRIRMALFNTPSVAAK